MRSGQAAVHGDGLAIDVGRAVTQQETGHLGDLVRLTMSLEGIDLADAVRCAAFARTLECRPGHAPFDEPGTDGVDPDTLAIQLVGRCLHHADHSDFGCAVVDASGIGTQSCDGCGANDCTGTLPCEVRNGVFDGQEYTDGVNPECVLLVFHGQFSQGFAATGNTCIGVDSIDTPRSDLHTRSQR